LEKNKRFWITKHIFGKQIFEHLYEIFLQFKFETDLDYKKYRVRAAGGGAGGGGGGDITNEQLEVQKFVITFLLTVSIRASTRIQIPNFINLVRRYLKNSVGLSIWLLQTFSCQEMIKEFFVDCSVFDMSRFLAGLLKTAMATVYEAEEPLILQYLSQPKINNYVQET
jgi:hypothetical protein